MTRQINLFHPRYLKKREWLTLNNVAAAVVAVLGTFAIAGGWAWRDATVRGAEAAAAEASLKQAKDQLATLTQVVATRKPGAALLAEVATAEETLARRGQIVRLLESGVIGNSAGFSEYLRGFARQTTPGLWLTGFSIGSGGEDIEVRGRMASSTALPEYIRRLGSEKAFQGRSFAALTVDRPVPAVAVAAPAGAAAPPAVPGFAEFVLIPRRDGSGGKQ